MLTYCEPDDESDDCECILHLARSRVSPATHGGGMLTYCEPDDVSDSFERIWKVDYPIFGFRSEVSVRAVLSERDFSHAEEEIAHVVHFLDGKLHNISLSATKDAKSMSSVECQDCSKEISVVE